MSAAPLPESTNAAAALAAFVAGFDLDTVPAAVKARAKLSILDAFGIGLASTNYPFAHALSAALTEIGGTGDFPVIGSALRLPQRDAAHLNGTLIHGLDFDDTHGESVVHTSASAVPTMFIAGLANNCSGADALAAYIIAAECASRIGAAARGGFHERGFHPTGVVGAFGCALAAGYLYGLDAEQLRDAQGIVLSQAGGSLQFLDDGAWTKRNHPGWASVCGQTAAVMAKHGYSGPCEPYFGRYGLFPLHTNDGCDINADKITAGLGSDWEMSNIAFKPYPACHMTHAFADAARTLKAAHGFEPEAIERIIAYVDTREIPVICEPVATKVRPQNSYDAQFSVNYVIAAALVRDRFGLAELEDEALADPAITALCGKVDYRPDPDSAYPDYYSGALDIHLRDGRCLHHREQMNRGSAENPMADDDIRNKFRDNAGRTITAANTEAALSLIENLESECSLDALARVLCQPA